MRILVAIDSFKGAVSSRRAGNAFKKGLSLTNWNDVEVCSVADGGEGSLEALMENLDGNIQLYEVEDAFHKKIKIRTFFFQKGNDLYCAIETADIFGLHNQIPESNTVYRTSTYGLGQLLKALEKENIRKVMIFVGGTITTDAGLGLLQGLGVTLYDAHHTEILKGINPLFSFSSWNKEELNNIQTQFQSMEIVVGCVVKAPLYGESGCARCYAKQKGADENQIALLEKQLQYFARYSGMDFMKQGFGAGGGCPASLKLLGAQLFEGFDLLSDFCHLEEKIQTADLIVTGEGQINAQTLQGKLPIQIAQLSKKYQKPVIAICGQKIADCDSLRDIFDGIFSIQTGIVDLKQAMMNTEINIEELAYQLGKLLHAVKKGLEYAN